MKLNQTAKEFQQQARTQFGIAIAGAFAFVIALTWNDFIKEVVAKLVTALGLTAQTWLFRFITAILITIICVMGIIYFSKWGKK